MDHKILYADDIINAIPRATDGSWNLEARGKSVQEAALIEHPTYLGYIDSVNYGVDKSNRDYYVFKFNNAKSSVKATVEASEFLLTEWNNPMRRMKPQVYVRMEKGEIVSVCLLYLSKEQS